MFIYISDLLIWAEVTSQDGNKLWGRQTLRQARILLSPQIIDCGVGKAPNTSCMCSVSTHCGWPYMASNATSSYADNTAGRLPLPRCGTQYADRWLQHSIAQLKWMSVADRERPADFSSMTSGSNCRHHTWPILSPLPTLNTKFGKSPRTVNLQKQ